MATQTELLVRLTRVAALKPRSETFTRRLCQALAEISDMDGASMSIGDAVAIRSVLHATDELAARIEEVQDAVCEGPSLAAYHLGTPVHADAAALDQRWPMFAQMVAPAPLARVLAVPVRPTGDVIGVLTLYGREPDPAALALDELQFLANAIGSAVVGAIQRVEEQALWSDRDLVSQATGMVIAQLGLDPADALAVMRAHAFAHSTTLADISTRLTERRLDFSRDVTPDRTKEDDR
jgi:transcriptional regulator with GAF, ATPase, and Fis domain